MKAYKPATAKDLGWSQLMPLAHISVIQAQIWDNRGKTLAKNQADPCLRVNVWSRPWGVNLEKQDHEWFRYIQLRKPATVLRWAMAKHKAGELSADQLGIYEEAASGLDSMDPETFDVTRMGHITAPIEGTAGTHYFPGHFVSLSLTKDGRADVVIFRGAEMLHLDNWGPSKTRNKWGKPKDGTPRLVKLYDPTGIIDRQREAEAKLAAMPSVASDPAPMTPEQAFRTFLSDRP